MAHREASYHDVRKALLFGKVAGKSRRKFNEGDGACGQTLWQQGFSYTRRSDGARTSMMMKRKASAVWSGTLQDGKGVLSTESKILVGTPYSFRARFEEEPGTNPEELIGTAHAGCFSMALSMILGLDGIVPERIETEATITLEKSEDGFAITASHLDVIATIPDVDDSVFQRAVEKAKSSCTISKLLKATITVSARLA